MSDAREDLVEPRRHAPGLDGVRALAVMAVVGYHLGLPGLRGGLLGVSVFFTLSGYLITSILVAEHAGRGSIALGPFWARRARRLLPAAWGMLAAVLLTAVFTRSPKLGEWSRQAFYAVIYVANWATIARGDDYFSRFAGPGPLDHLWSLAIEEQFYLVWPTLVLALSRFAGRRRALAVTAGLVLASTLAMAWLHDPTAVNNTRAYEGTDARAAALLVGALAAWLAPFHTLRALPARRARMLDVVGGASSLVVLVCFVILDDRTTFFYRGGELLLSLVTACWVACAAHPSSVVARVLSTEPLRWLGLRSYGIYLWHMPVIALVPLRDPALRAAVQLALTLVLAALSYEWLEEPIRRRQPLDLARVVRMMSVAPVAAVSLMLLHRAQPRAALAAEPLLALSAPAATAPVAAPTEAAAAVASSSAAPLETRCRTVIHIGDSTSLSLISKEFLPRPEDQLAARYRAVGVETFVPEISGARSIVEKWEDKASAWEVVHRKRGGGYQGCWVFALGTNDPANIKGNLPGLTQRIDWMMVQAEGRPVLWTSTRSLLSSGSYDDAYMRSWNRALADACARYPNMRVFDWASEVVDAWFMPDGIHPNPVGARERARRFAATLARAFPKHGPSPAECFVRATP